MKNMELSIPMFNQSKAFKATKKKWNQIAVAVLLGLVTFSSCNKDEVVNPSLPLQNESAIVIPDGVTRNYEVYSDVNGTKGTVSRAGSVYAVRNFAQGNISGGGTDSTWAISGTYYFNFTQNDGATDANYQITFTGSASGDIKARTTGGYTLAYIDKAFASVTASDSFTAATSNTIGINSVVRPTGSTVYGNGWYNYNLTTHIVSAQAGRTLVLLQNGTPKFKFKINSLYTGETPNAPVAATNYPYYSFDYQAF